MKNEKGKIFIPFHSSSYICGYILNIMDRRESIYSFLLLQNFYNIFEIFILYLKRMKLKLCLLNGTFFYYTRKTKREKKNRLKYLYSGWFKDVEKGKVFDI